MRDGKVVGWAVLLNTQMSGHKHFGDMRVGTLVDCLAKPEDARDVVACARDVLEANGADLIVSNQGSRAWGQALKHCGFLQGPSNLPFLASPKLAALLEPFAETPRLPSESRRRRRPHPSVRSDRLADDRRYHACG